MPRHANILPILGLLAGGQLVAGCKPAAEATEVPSAKTGAKGEASCRHELGRCGGHVPGDGACGGSTEVPAGPDHHDAATAHEVLAGIVVEPGKFAEVNLQMAKGSTATVEFTSSGGALSWNIHSHVDDRAVIHNEGAAAAGTVRFVAQSDGAFSYLWKNDGTVPVTLTAKLQSEGAVNVHSVHPAKK